MNIPGSYMSYDTFIFYIIITDIKVESEQAHQAHKHVKSIVMNGSLIHFYFVFTRTVELD